MAEIGPAQSKITVFALIEGCLHPQHSTSESFLIYLFCLQIFVDK